MRVKFMDPINYVKIVSSFITLVICTIIGIIEIKKNPKNWLNRFFAAFFIFNALGLVTYTIYHFIFNDADLVINIVIITQILWNIGFCSFIMVVPLIKYSEKVAINGKTPKIVFVIIIVLSIGFVLYPPYISDMPEYLINHHVHTEIQPVWWKIIVHSYRIVILLYVLLEFYVIARNSQGEFRNQLKKFSLGIILLILGLIALIFTSGSSINAIAFQLIGNILVIGSAFMILNGFKKKKRNSK
jgi:hypothetical protein